MGGQTSVSDERPHVAVVVVHGVGEVVPGEIAEALLDTMDKKPDIEADKRREIVELDDRVQGQKPGSEQRRYHTTSFPAHIHSAKLDTGERVTFAELYWADLTRVGTGRVNTLLGLFRVMFEAHYLIDAMLNRRGGFITRILRFLLLLLSQFLRGPLVAVTICFATICWLAVNANHIGQKQPNGFIQWLFSGVGIEGALAAALVIPAIGAGAMALWLWRAGDLTWVPTLAWTAVCALLIAAALLLAHRPEVPWQFEVTPANAIRQSYIALDALWWLWGWGFIGALAIATMLALISGLRTLAGQISRSERRTGAAALTATGTLALQFVMWGALSGTLLLPILGRCEEIVALTVMRDAIDAQSVAALAKHVDPGASNPAQAADRYRLLEDLLNVPRFEPWQFEFIERYKYVYGYSAVIVIAFLAVFLALIALRRLIVALSRSYLHFGAPLMPRLLFNANATIVLLAFVLIQISINGLLSEDFQNIIERLKMSECKADTMADLQGLLATNNPLDVLFMLTVKVAGLVNISQQTVCQVVIYNRHTIIALAAVLSVGLPLLLGNSLNNALHIARDLIDHHYGPREGRAYAAAADINMVEDERRPRRARIRHRLHTLLDDLRKRGPIDGVVFVAHSQGSVIVYDYVADAAERGYPELGGLQPAIVTCGSPLMHLYERYFHEYARLGATLAGIEPRHRGWANLYRIDDYIGARVGREDRIVANQILPAGGHADYWREEPVAAAVREAIGRVLAGPRPAPPGRS